MALLASQIGDILDIYQRIKTIIDSFDSFGEKDGPGAGVRDTRSLLVKVIPAHTSRINDRFGRRVWVRRPGTGV